MKAVVVLNGISYVSNYKHWTNNIMSVDFRDNYKNIVHTIISPLRDAGYDVDVFCVSYENEIDHLLSFYFDTQYVKLLPKERLISSSQTYVLDMILESLDMITFITTEIGCEYDLVVMTHFDANLDRRITQLVYEPKKINFLCRASLNRTNLTCNDDAVFIMDGKHIEIFKNAVRCLKKENTELGHHKIYDMLLKQGSKDILHFIEDNDYEIFTRRPFVTFNKELNLFPTEFNVKTLRPLLGIKYRRTNGTCLEWQDDGVATCNFFKPSGVEESIIYDIEHCSTCYVEVKFKIKALHDNSVKNVVITLKGNDGSCQSTQVDATFDTNEFTMVSCVLQMQSTFASRVHIMFSKNRFAYVSICDMQAKCINHNCSRLHFVSFYTEGQPRDFCLNMTAIKEQYEKTISPYVDATRFWRPRDMLKDPKTYDYVKRFDTQPNPYNPGVHNIGFLRWKPYIILKELENVEDGDIVFYRDGNIVKYPAILEGIENTRELAHYVLQQNKTDIFVPIEEWPLLKMKGHVKREIFEALGEYNFDYLESYLFNTSIVICKKSSLSMQIMQDWLKACMQSSLIQYETSHPQHPDFKWNVQEQSIINVILKKYMIEGKLPNMFPMYSMYGRCFTFDKMVRVPKVAVLLAGEMRNFDCQSLLAYNKKHLFDRYNCDVFVSTWSHKGFSFDHGFHKDKDYANDIITEDVIKTAYDRVRGINIEQYDVWYASLDPRTRSQIDKGFYNVGCNKLCPCTAFSQTYKLWDANRLRKQYEKETATTYDIVIRFRPDFMFLEDIPPEFIKPLVTVRREHTENRLYHLNPPGIYQSNRVYDVFFYGNSQVMDILADTWLNIHDLIAHPLETGVADVNTCRLLYIQSIMNNIVVIDIPRAIGDIYRDENLDEFRHKILDLFNARLHDTRLNGIGRRFLRFTRR